MLSPTRYLQTALAIYGDVKEFQKGQRHKVERYREIQRETVGENQLLDDAGNLARDIHGQVYPMYSAEIPY
jgi:hypothetical protein